MTVGSIARHPAASASAALFGRLSALRRRRSLHPDGASYHATVRIDGDGEPHRRRDPSCRAIPGPARPRLQRKSACQTERVTARERLAAARLYLVCDARPRAFLDAALRGGADIVQLRDKTLDDDGLIAAARVFRAAADAHGALFVLNDRPDLVEACAADGVHVGQEDGTPSAARALVGPERIVGRSTHAPAQADEADADPDVDYLAVGPVHATPTKPGRPAVGLDYVAYAARAVHKPWFAIGGLDAETLPAAVEHGARRAVVVRAITEAEDPERAAAALRAALEVPVGAAQP
jgi:thiamine-phosphate pyrophosphorylase